MKDSPLDEINFDKYNSLGDVIKALLKIGLKENVLDDDYLISYLSGGEKVKLQICKLLIENNNILLLDEPTNDLDIETLKWLEDFIVDTDIPIIFVSHDETLLENTANVIIHLEQIKKKSDARYTVEKMGYKEYVEKRIKKIDTQNRLASNDARTYKSELKTLKEIKSKVRQANPGRTNRMNSLLAQEKRLSEENRIYKADVEEAINIIFPDVFLPNSKVVLDLEINNLVVSKKLLSKNISLYVKGPEHIVIVGKNGAGKSTFIKYIYDVLKDRTDLKVGYMPQDYDDVLKLQQTPIEFLKGSQFEESYVRSLMGNMKFTSDEMTSIIKNLSGGQKAKVLLMKLILEKCEVLLLDEPTRNLSPLSNPIIRETLSNYSGAIISVSHDRKYIADVCEKAYILNENGLQQIDVEKAINPNKIKKK